MIAEMEGLKRKSSPLRKTARVSKKRITNLNYDQLCLSSPKSTKVVQPFTAVARSKYEINKLRVEENKRIALFREVEEFKLRPRSSSVQTMKDNRSANIPKKLLDAIKFLKEIDESLASTLSLDNKMLQDNSLTSIRNKSPELCSINKGNNNLHFKEFIMKLDISETLLLLSDDKTFKNKLPKLSTYTIGIIDEKNHSHTIKYLLEAHEEISSLRLVDNKLKKSTNLCKKLSKSCCNINFFPVSLLFSIFRAKDGQRKDTYCWRCNKDGVEIGCTACSRSFHPTCVKENPDSETPWVCYECINIMNAENIETRSVSMRGLTVFHLSKLLSYVIQRIKTVPDSKIFQTIDYARLLPNYFNEVFSPMFINTLEENNKQHQFGSTTALISSVRRIFHNSIAYYGAGTPEMQTAKTMLKICSEETSEIELCAQCYFRANEHKVNWFIEVCDTPHVLLWAKLKGYPYWPAKALHSNNNTVVCKFFGGHNKGNVPLQNCFLYSDISPKSGSLRPSYINEFNIALEEISQHIQNIKDKFTVFVPANPKTRYSPDSDNTQLLRMIPHFRLPVAGEACLISEIEALDIKPEVDILQSSALIEVDKLHKLKSSQYMEEVKSEDQEIDIVENDIKPLNFDIFDMPTTSINNSISDDIKQSDTPATSTKCEISEESTNGEGSSENWVTSTNVIKRKFTHDYESNSPKFHDVEETKSPVTRQISKKKRKLSPHNTPIEVKQNESADFIQISNNKSNDTNEMSLESSTISQKLGHINNSGLFQEDNLMATDLIMETYMKAINSKNKHNESSQSTKSSLKDTDVNNMSKIENAELTFNKEPVQTLKIYKSKKILNNKTVKEEQTPSSSNTIETVNNNSELKLACAMASNKCDVLEHSKIDKDINIVQCTRETNLIDGIIINSSIGIFDEFIGVPKEDENSSIEYKTPTFSNLDMFNTNEKPNNSIINENDIFSDYTISDSIVNNENKSANILMINGNINDVSNRCENKLIDNKDTNNSLIAKDKVINVNKNTPVNNKDTPGNIIDFHENKADDVIPNTVSKDMSVDVSNVEKNIVVDNTITEDILNGNIFACKTVKTDNSSVKASYIHESMLLNKKVTNISTITENMPDNVSHNHENTPIANEVNISKDKSANKVTNASKITENLLADINKKKVIILENRLLPNHNLSKSLLRNKGENKFDSLKVNQVIPPLFSKVTNPINVKDKSFKIINLKQACNKKLSSDFPLKKLKISNLLENSSTQSDECLDRPGEIKTELNDSIPKHDSQDLRTKIIKSKSAENVNCREPISLVSAQTKITYKNEDFIDIAKGNDDTLRRELTEERFNETVQISNKQCNDSNVDRNQSAVDNEYKNTITEEDITTEQYLEDMVKQAFDKNSQKLIGVFREMCTDMVKTVTNEAKNQLEKFKQEKKCEVLQIIHNMDLIRRESEWALKYEHSMQLKQKLCKEKEAAVVPIKSKLLCTVCKKETILICCKNNSYCSAVCQELDWPFHMNTCNRMVRTIGQKTSDNTSTRSGMLTSPTNGTSCKINASLPLLLPLTEI